MIPLPYAGYLPVGQREVTQNITGVTTNEILYKTVQSNLHEGDILHLPGQFCTYTVYNSESQYCSSLTSLFFP